MTIPRPHRETRDLQIMPADGWWAVYAEADGTVFRQRVVGFALCEEWYTRDESESAPGPDAEVRRYMRALTWQDGYIDSTSDCDNLLAIVHADEWAEREADFVKQAQEAAARAKRTKVGASA